MKNYITLIILSSVLFSSIQTPSPAQAQTGQPFTAANESELRSLLAINTGTNGKYITLINNILSGSDIGTGGGSFTVLENDVITIDLNRYNFQGNAELKFEVAGSGQARIDIIGSSAAFNGGLKLHDQIEMDYAGIYVSSILDILGRNPGDQVTFTQKNYGSGWNAATALPVFIATLPANLDDIVSPGTLVIGGEGSAAMSVEKGNWVTNGETIVGAKNTGRISTLHISGYDDREGQNGTPSRWKNAGTFYIGFEGKGETTIENRAEVFAGSIGVGVAGTGEGLLTITGTGGNTVKEDVMTLDPKTTTVYLFGRNDNPGGLTSSGNGTLNLSNGAHLIFDERDPDKKRTNSGFHPKLSLGSGSSTADNSLITGAVNAQYDYTGRHVQNTGQIIGKNDSSTNLTLQNKTVIEGSLEFRSMGAVNAESRSVITPGFGKDEHPYINAADKTFGRFDFDADAVTLDSTVQTYIDFDVHGDKNADTHTQASNHEQDGATVEPHYPYTGADERYPIDNTVKGTTSKGYLADQGRDLINVTKGTAALDGDIYFRPQAGYYSDHIDVDFLHGQNSGEFRFHIVPERWFADAHIDYNRTAGADLVMERHTSPFRTAADSANTYGAGGALDQIYNAQNNYSWLHVLHWVWTMNDQELRTAVRQLSGEARAASMLMPVRSPWRFGFDRVNWSEKSRNVYFGTQNAATPKPAKWDLWITPYYDYVHENDDGNASAATTQRVSFVGGYDRAVSRKGEMVHCTGSAWGLLFGYSQPKLDQRGSRSIADDFLFGVHFHTRIGGKYEAKLWGGAGVQQYKLSRSVPIPNVPQDYLSQYSGMSYSAAGQIARPFRYQNGTIRPFAGGEWNYVHQGSAEESGYRQARLRFETADWTQFFGRLGVKADYAWSKCNLSASVSYAHLLFGDAAPEAMNRFIEAGGDSFAVTGNNPGRGFVSLGLGTQFDLDVCKRSVFFVKYIGDYSSRSNAQNFALGWQKLF